MQTGTELGNVWEWISVDMGKMYEVPEIYHIILISRKSGKFNDNLIIPSPTYLISRHNLS